MICSTVSLAALLFTLNALEAVLALTQEKSVSVNVGDNVKIPCKETGGSYMSWYQQKPGSVPRFVCYTTTRGSGFPSRFSCTTHSQSTQYLNINGVQAEDLATYYCACVGCSTDTGFGDGTELIIARPPSPPSLVLMAPAQPPLPGASTTLLCLAEGYHPDGATLSWSENGASVTGSEVQTDQSQRQPDGTYSLSSLLTLTSTRWHTGHTFSCHLGHSALSSPVSKSVSEQQCSP